MRSNVGFDTDALCPSAASEYTPFAGAGGLSSSARAFKIARIRHRERL